MYPICREDNDARVRKTVSPDVSEFRIQDRLSVRRKIRLKHQRRFIPKLRCADKITIYYAIANNRGIRKESCLAHRDIFEMRIERKENYYKELRSLFPYFPKPFKKKRMKWRLSIKLFKLRTALQHAISCF